MEGTAGCKFTLYSQIEKNIYAIEKINLITLIFSEGDRDNPDVRLSKFLSYICRHGAEKEGLVISDGMFRLN